MVYKRGWFLTKGTGRDKTVFKKQSKKQGRK